MLIASHQPNFAPYMGFFYKMYCADVFTISDEVVFSRRGFQNYNFVDDNGERRKITIPVNSHTQRICDVKIVNWEHSKKKLLKTLEWCYGRQPHYEELKSILTKVFEKEYTYIKDLNLSIIEEIKNAFGISTKIVCESELNIDYKNPSEDICLICEKCGGTAYMSGSGALAYMDMKTFLNHGIRVLWSNYEDKWDNLSVFDYIARYGCTLPKEFEKMKGELLHGRNEF